MRPESAHPAHPACPSLPGLSPATWRPAPARAVACLAALAALATPFTLAGLPRPAHAQPAAPAPQAAAGTREVVTTADQLPRRTVRLDKLPSQYLDAPRAELQTMADALERNLRADLERYEIRDASTLRGYHGMLLLLAQFKGDWAAVPAAVETLRHLQDKPGQKATTGVLANLLAEQQAGGRDSAWVQAEVTRRYGALAWSDVADSVKAMRGQFELMNPALVKGGFEQQLDVMARNADKVLPEGIVATVLGARLQLELLMPQRQAVVAGLQAVIERHAQAEQRPDLWTPRQFSIAPGTPAAEVGIGVWDSGVDLSLFKPTPGRGIAFDADSRRSDALLRPLGEAAARWPQLEQLVKGAMDLQAALDTPDARQLKQVVAGLEAGQAKAFQEDLALAGLYTHGTHVAGIAVDGNPQARVFAASMLWSHRSEPLRPSEAHSQRVAQAYRDIVAAFRAEKLRVVNMSWRYGAAAYEGALAWHNVGASADERRQIARRLFAIERDALREAIASAPEILFVAGSGNEDNNADFAEYIPAGLELPNLITVGAVDRSGRETHFSTFGRTVVVHANGFEVESLLPGGRRVRFSGTSMASPQVANLAAKLFALQPSLTVVQVKEAIIKGADAQGRVRLLHPRRSAELLGLTLPTGG